MPRRVAAADHLELAAVRVERLTQSMELSRQALREAWTTQATDSADADLGVLAIGLPWSAPGWTRREPPC